MMNKLTESIQRAASCSDMAAESGTNVHVGLRGACGTDVTQDTGAEESADEVRASGRKLMQLQETMRETDAKRKIVPMNSESE